MHLIKNEKIINIMEKTLNHMDPRLVNHGKRVAYLMFRILEPLRMYNNKKLRDICILAMLHDIGAYKTEEIDKMVIFETSNTWEHSVYGYLFLKYYSPLKEMADVVRYHHSLCSEIEHLDSDRKLLTQLLSMCDRIDIFLKYSKDANGIRDHLQKYRDKKYFGYVTDIFLKSDIDISSVYDGMNSDAVFNEIFYNTPLTGDEVDGYIRMIIFSIDFRSSQTVIHTVTTACTACCLAGFLGIGKKDAEKIKTGAMLHDIGKIGIPVHILESTGKLSESDMEIMKTHVVLSEEILDGNVDDDIKYPAVRHHEKLNGTGYPNKINGGDLSLEDRIIAVADIFSALCGSRSYKDKFPKEKTIKILNEMSGLIDPEIVSLAVKHYDEILEEVEMESLPVIGDYNSIYEEYRNLCRVNEVSFPDN